MTLRSFLGQENGKQYRKFSSLSKSSSSNCWHNSVHCERSWGVTTSNFSAGLIWDNKQQVHIQFFKYIHVTHNYMYLKNCVLCCKIVSYVVPYVLYLNNCIVSFKKLYCISNLYCILKVDMYCNVLSHVIKSYVVKIVP